MVKTYATEQEQFWAGSFGDQYSKRNLGAKWIASNTHLFSRVFSRTDNVASVLELGANIGLNLRAIAGLLPEAKLAAVEINGTAVDALTEWGGCTIHQQSLLDFSSETTFDFTFAKGVLIHINPDHLPKAYDVLHSSSSRYILVAEYYNPTPTAVPYRGHSDKLFKRDFAGEMLDRFPDLHLLECGFGYHRDPNFPQDDICWFLMEKRNP